MLASANVDRYRRDGVLLVRNVVRGEELRLLQDAADRLQDAAVAYGEELDAVRSLELRDDHGFTEWADLDAHNFLYGRGKKGERIWRRAEKMWDRDAIYRVVTANPEILDTVQQILGGPVVPANSAMVVKMPGGGAAVPWHRDPNSASDGLARDGSDDFVCDVYLDRSTVHNGCLWAIPGSHRGPETDVAPLDFSRTDAVALEVEPGDMLLHSTAALHGSPANTSSERRRTLYLHYRTPAALAAAGHPGPWVDERAALLAGMRTERSGSGLDSDDGGASTDGSGAGVRAAGAR